MLNKSRLRTGRTIFDSPSYIFVRDGGGLSFFNLLKRFEIEYELNSNNGNPRNERFEFYASFSSGWLTIMDNWWYSLYHLNNRYPFIDELGKEYEIFQCVVGGSDHSYEFKYHKNG